MPAAAPVTPNSKNPLRGAVEIIPDKLYYCALKSVPNSNRAILRNRRNKKTPVHLLNVDEELVYWNFFLDFGPLNLGQLYRFCSRLNHMLKVLEGRRSRSPQETTKSGSSRNRESSKEGNNEMILFFSSTAPAKRANAIFLITAWQMLHLGRSPEDAFYGFRASNVGSSSMVEDVEEANGGKSKRRSMIGNRSEPPPYPLTTVGQNTVAALPPFHDASPCACTYELTLLHCLEGLLKARQLKFFDWDTFDVDEYEHYEQVENGDLNWIMKDKIMAFAGPSFKKTVSPEGYCTLAPSDYIPYFQQKNVGLVVRLNKKCYEEQDFVKAGIEHLDQFYLDGSCPPMKILQRVLTSFEAVPPAKAFAVHCKAGLGRTGTCIGAYMMKHYKFTASEAIGWMRICRPGMVIGPQQHFLEELEHTMWQEGDLMRGRVAAPIREKKTASSGRNKKAPSANGRSSSSSQTKAPTMTGEAVSGRAGQAEGLLAARQHRPKTTGGTMGPISPETKPKAKIRAIPITPDGTSKTRSLPIANLDDSDDEDGGEDAVELAAPPTSSSAPRWLKS